MEEGNKKEEESLLYFKNVGADYLMKKVQALEQQNADQFFRFICMGRSLIDYATQGDLQNFKRLFFESDDYDMMFWHVSKALKAAVKNKQVEIVRFITLDLQMSIDHEAFVKFIHIFLFSCQEAEMEDNDDAVDTNRAILYCLTISKGSAIDEMDNTNGSTPLQVACEYLYDKEMVKILVETGKADVNSVNNDGKMPLSLVKERLEREKNEQKKQKLMDILAYLEEKGGKLTWKSESRNY